MFCRNCGKQLGPGTNFCPACGTRVSAGTAGPEPVGYTPLNAVPPPSSGGVVGGIGAGHPEQLVRPRSPRLLGGVCAALALYYGWNLDLVRVLTAIFGLFYGVGILAYIACWIILPEGQYALPSQSG